MQLHRMFPLGLILLSSVQAADLSGHWEGSIKTPDMEVKIELDLMKDAGTINIPGQGLNGLALSNFTGEGSSVSFQIKGAPGERKFSGVLSADAKSISGDFTQEGYTMPFRIAWMGEARPEARVKNAPIGKEMEGTWSGAMGVDGKQKRMILRLSNQPDGAAAGSIFSVEEGLEVPIAVITQKDSSLRLDLKAVSGVYSGDLSADRTELAGTFTQGSLVVPLTFRKQ